MSNSLWCRRLQHARFSVLHYWSLLKFMSIESMMLSICLVLCCPLLLPSIFPSIRVFSNESIQQKCPEGPLHARPLVGCFHSYYLVKNFFILLKHNWITILCWFLPYSTVIQVYTHTHIYLLSLHGLLQDTEYNSLCYTVGPCSSSILCIIVCIC